MLGPVPAVNFQFPVFSLSATTSPTAAWSAAVSPVRRAAGALAAGSAGSCRLAPPKAMAARARRRRQSPVHARAVRPRDGAPLSEPQRGWSYVELVRRPVQPCSLRRRRRNGESASIVSGPFNSRARIDCESVGGGVRARSARGSCGRVHRARGRAMRFTELGQVPWSCWVSRAFVAVPVRVAQWFTVSRDRRDRSIPEDAQFAEGLRVAVCGSASPCRATGRSLDGCSRGALG
jgi:hypothetical protein